MKNLSCCDDGGPGTSPIAPSPLRTLTRAACILVITLLLIIPLVSWSAPVSRGDGMGIYPDKPYDDPVYGATWEVRQLAGVEYLNSSHQKLSLFLTVTSFYPGENITVAVPFRTLPGSMAGNAAGEGDFRARFHMDDIQERSRSQDPEEMRSRFMDDVETTMMWGLSGALAGVPGAAYYEYFHHHYSDRNYGSNGKNDGSMSAGIGGGEEPRKPEAVQHYDFEGGTIDVFDATSEGLTAMELIDLLDLDLSEKLTSVFDDYSDHYVVLIRAASSPPIDQEKYSLISEYVPGTLADFIEYSKEYPILAESRVESLYRNYEELIFDELEELFDVHERYALYNQIRDHFEELIYATYGFASYQGFVIEADLPLDRGKMFFPLGTSVGWENPIHDTRIVFALPEDRSLESDRPGSSAYIDNKHYYLYAYSNFNPDFDIDGGTVGSDGAGSARRTEWVYEHSFALSMILSTAILFLYWFTATLMVSRPLGIKLGPKDLLKPKYLILFPVTFFFSFWIAIGFLLVLSGQMIVKAKTPPGNELSLAAVTSLSSTPAGTDAATPLPLPSTIDPILRNTLELSTLCIFFGIIEIVIIIISLEEEFCFLLLFILLVIYVFIFNGFTGLLRRGGTILPVGQRFQPPPSRTGIRERGPYQQDDQIRPPIPQTRDPPINDHLPGFDGPERDECGVTDAIDLEPIVGPPLRQPTSWESRSYPQLSSHHPLRKRDGPKPSKSFWFKRRLYPPIQRDRERWKEFLHSGNGWAVSPVVVLLLGFHFFMVIGFISVFSDNWSGNASQSRDRTIITLYLLSHCLLFLLPGTVLLHLRSRTDVQRSCEASSSEKTWNCWIGQGREFIILSLVAIGVMIFGLLSSTMDSIRRYDEIELLTIGYLAIFIATGSLLLSRLNRSIPHTYASPPADELVSIWKRQGRTMLVITSILAVLAFIPAYLLYTHELYEIYDSAGFMLPLFFLTLIQWIVLPVYVVAEKRMTNTQHPLHIVGVIGLFYLSLWSMVISFAETQEMIQFLLFLFPISLVIIGSFIYSHPRILREPISSRVLPPLVYPSLLFWFPVLILTIQSGNFFDMYSTRRLVAIVFIFFYLYVFLLALWNFHHARSITDDQIAEMESNLSWKYIHPAQTFYAATHPREP